jgi:hypothetical protein
MQVRRLDGTLKIVAEGEKEDDAAAGYELHVRPAIVMGYYYF